MVASGTSTPTSMTVVGDEDARIASREGGHRRVLVPPRHLAMNKADARAEMLPQGLEAIIGRRHVQFLGLVHQRTDPIHPGATVQRPADRCDHIT